MVRDCKLPEGSKVEFSGVLFQPRPWTPTETKGMPVEIEQQYYSKPEVYQVGARGGSAARPCKQQGVTGLCLRACCAPVADTCPRPPAPLPPPHTHHRPPPTPHSRCVHCQVINVPPVFMFRAKIFQPPRLCAVYKRL